jgi:hypothetical protein
MGHVHRDHTDHSTRDVRQDWERLYRAAILESDAGVVGKPETIPAGLLPPRGKLLPMSDFKFGGEHYSHCVCPVCKRLGGDHYSYCVCPICKKLGGDHYSHCVCSVCKKLGGDHHSHCVCPVCKKLG